MKKNKTKIIIMIMAILALSVGALFLTACNGETEENMEVFTLYFNVNYVGGTNFTREYSRPYGCTLSITIPSDIVIDRGENFHLISFYAIANDGSGERRVRRGGSVAYDWFDGNNRLELRAEWFDLTIYHAFEKTMQLRSFALVEIMPNGNTWRAEKYEEGELIIAYGNPAAQRMWYRNGILYADRSMQMGGGRYRIANFDPNIDRGFSNSFSTTRMGPLHSMVGRLSQIQRYMEYDSVANMNGLFRARDHTNRISENVFRRLNQEYTIENGLITCIRVFMTGMHAEGHRWIIYCTVDNLEEFIDNYIPERPNVAFNESFIFTAALANNSNADEVRMRGTFDWMVAGTYTIAQLTARVDVFIGGAIVSNPTLRFFMDREGTQEVVDSFVLAQHSQLFIKLVT